ncbi:hypothetical protein Taro_047210 [Colocasia esculenta]|uniref:Uncharacterized protein n=1 Tax=Colocasia esculenta TaxID=4460 RepID=A0A843X7U3_COLES|nr:hypothetical protein [Colocasia esculenta]
MAVHIATGFSSFFFFSFIVLFVLGPKVRRTHPVLFLHVLIHDEGGEEVKQRIDADFREGEGTCFLIYSRNVVSGTRHNKMTGKRVKLLDLENEQVAKGIVLSVDPKKIVVGRPTGHVLVDEAKRSLFSGINNL